MNNFTNNQNQNSNCLLLSSHLPGFNKLTEKVNHNINDFYFNYDPNNVFNCIQDNSLQKANINDMNNNLIKINLNNFTSNFKSNDSNTNNMILSNKDKYNCNTNTVKYFEFEESIESKNKKQLTAIKKKQQAAANNDSSAYNISLKKKKEEALKAQYYNPRKNTIEHMHNLTVLSEYNKQNLDKFLVSLNDINKDVFYMHGRLFEFSDKFKREYLNTLSPIQLNQYSNYSEFKKVKFFNNVSPLDDTVLNSYFNYDIYISDKLLSYIMTMNFNSHSWHILIKKENKKLVFYPDEFSEVTLTTVDESLFSPDLKSNVNLNKFDSLANEATLINNLIKEKVLGNIVNINSNNISLKSHPFINNKINDKNEDDNNYDDEEDYNNSNEKHKYQENSSYSYQGWTIGDMKVLVRCNIHCAKIEALDNSKTLKKINVYALNEYNTYDFKNTNKPLENHFQQELTKNHIKISRWAIQSYLGDVDTVKIGYVSRKNINSANEHILYGFQDLEPNKIMKFTNFNIRVGWGMLKEIYDVIIGKEDGNFVVAKYNQGYNQLVRLYKIVEKEES